MIKLLIKFPGPLLFALIATMMAGLTPAFAQEEAGPVDEYLELVEASGADYAPAFDFFTVSMLWTVIAAALVFIMHLGFACLETGMTQSKNTVNILFKNSKEIIDELNLNVIPMYQKRYEGIVNSVGFSGHHSGVAPDIAAYMMGSRIIERHYTLSRSMKGTDHPGSLELQGVQYILKYIEQVKQAMGSSEKRVLESEMPALMKLRGDLKR